MSIYSSIIVFFLNTLITKSFGGKSFGENFRKNFTIFRSHILDKSKILKKDFSFKANAFSLVQSQKVKIR